MAYLMRTKYAITFKKDVFWLFISESCVTVVNVIPRPVTSSRFAEEPMIINIQTTPVYLYRYFVYLEI